jgi:hypothetical protein
MKQWTTRTAVLTGPLGVMSRKLLGGMSAADRPYDEGGKTRRWHREEGLTIVNVEHQYQMLAEYSVDHQPVPGL